MLQFIGRKQELADLDALQAESGAQFLIMYGRRRVGKTTLLLHWAQQSGLPFVYWVANRLSPALQLRSLSQALYNASHPQSPADADFTYPSWEMALREAAQLAADRRFIIIVDEFPYAAEAEPGLPSLLQNAWDHHFKQTQAVLILAGSHVGMMTRLMDYQAPLYGRFTGHVHLKPLPFSVTVAFLPRYSADERVAAYAILGGIPAYLERFDDTVSLGENVRRRIFRPTGIFRVDPLFLLQDQVREPRNFLSVLYAIGAGNHNLSDIARAAGLHKQNVSTYLGRLEDLYLVERRVPVTLPPERRERTRQGTWHLRDAYLRFYFRFVVPNQQSLELELLDVVWEYIHDQLRSFVGATAFEELCREWVRQQAIARKLAFYPQIIGSHRSPKVQVDVVGVNWRSHDILLGECKWGASPIGRGILRELVETKIDRVLNRLPDQGAGWSVHLAFFAREGFTEAARAYAKERNILLVDLAQLDRDMREI